MGIGIRIVRRVYSSGVLQFIWHCVDELVVERYHFFAPPFACDHRQRVFGV